MSARAGLRRRGRLERRSPVLTVCAVGVAMIFILPAVWLLVGSMRPSQEIFSSISPLSWRIGQRPGLAGLAGQDFEVVVELEVFAAFMDRPDMSGHDHPLGQGDHCGGTELDLQAV